MGVLLPYLDPRFKMKSKKLKPEDFIGWNSPDGNLKVIGIAGKQKNGKTLYKVTCKVCSGDKELFPTGYFISTKSNLIIGTKPCGCSFNPKWNKEQHMIRVSRLAKDRFIILGIADTFKGNKTKLRCECALDGYIWEPRILDIMLGKGCPKCGGRPLTNPSDALQKCVYLCSEGGYIPLGFPNGYKNSKSRFEYICTKHGKQNISYNNFVNAGNRCMGCSREVSNVYGYFKSKTEKEDYLYILSFNGQYIKVGRTFNINRRMKELVKESGCDNIEILYLYKAKHKDIFSIEQDIHNNLRSLGLEHHASTWSTETFNIDCLHLLQGMIKKYMLVPINNKS